LRKAALTVLALRAVNDEVATLREKFVKMDKNGDGTLDESELTAALTQSGEDWTGHTSTQLLKAMDTDGDGRVDYMEFLAATVEDEEVAHRDASLVAAFRVFDTNGDGLADGAELSRLLGGEPIRGSLNFHDFVNLVEGYADTQTSFSGYADTMISGGDNCNGSTPEIATTVPSSSDSSSQTDKNGSAKDKEDHSLWRPSLWNAR
jgi:calcium-dependent protein kinase